MPDDQHLPDDQPYDMGEPGREPEPAPAATTPAKPLLPVVPPAPVGASPLLAFVLSVVSDPTLRRHLEEAAWSLGDGQDDHMLTKAAALFSGVQQAHFARTAVVYAEHNKLLAHMDALLADLGTLLAERDLAGQQEPPDPEGAPGPSMNALRAAFHAEGTEMAKDAFKAGFRTALVVGAGGVIVGLVLAFIIHIL